MSLFTGLSKEICERAWVGAQGYIMAMFGTGELNKYDGTLIVVDPRVIDRPKASHIEDVFDSAIIFTAFANGMENPQCTKVARSKALASWRTGLPSSQIQQQYPYAYAEGDTFWGGSIVLPGGLIIAFSGVQECHDDGIAEVMGAAVRSISRDEMTKPDGVLDTWHRTRNPFLSSTPVMRD